jgi:hypothetical protein
MNTKLEKIFQTHIDLFFKRVQSKYSVDINDIKRDWIVFNSDPVFFCVYTFTRLPRKGETCGKKIKSGEYCRAHIQQAEKVSDKVSDKVSEKVSDKASEKVSDKASEKVSEKASQKNPPAEKLEVVKMNYKIGKYIHSPTKLAFFSKEHKVVYGKLSLHDTIIPLCDKDINVCKQYMFRYDLELIKQCL